MFQVVVFRNYLMGVQPVNLAKLTEQFLARSPIDIKRDNNLLERGNTYTLKVDNFLGEGCFCLIWWNVFNSSLVIKQQTISPSPTF